MFLGAQLAIGMVQFLEQTEIFAVEDDDDDD